MRYQLDLAIRPAEGALVRIIGMVERRGFTPQAIAGQIQTPGEPWHLKLVVQGARPAEALRRQLEKIYDCLSIRVIPMTDPAETTAVESTP